MGRKPSSQPVKLDLGGHCLSGQVLAVTFFSRPTIACRRLAPLRKRLMRAAGRQQSVNENAMNRKGPIKRSDEGMRRATGRDRDEWFTALDTWGTLGRPYREIAEWLTEEHGISNWWVQKLIVEYQQARGVRAPGVRPDGTFTATASKTLAVPGERAFEAFVDAKLRERWLPGAVMHERTSRPG